MTGGIRKQKINNMIQSNELRIGNLVYSVGGIDVDALKVRDEANLAYVTQTTLSVDDAARIVDALRRRDSKSLWMSLRYHRVPLRPVLKRVQTDGSVCPSSARVQSALWRGCR